MSSCTLAILGSLALLACTFEGAPVDTAGDGGPGGQTDASSEEGDANPVFDECEPPLVLESTKFHNPPMLVPDSRKFPPGVWLEFLRPGEIVVTQGSAGDRCAFLDYISNQGQAVRCAYEGRGQGSEFDFVRCQNAPEAAFEECGDPVSSQSNVSHQPIRATAITLLVDGDPALPSTVGQVVISGTCGSQ